MKQIFFSRLALCALVLAPPAALAADFTENIVILRNYQDYDEGQVVAAIEQLAAAQEKRAIGPLSELLDLPQSRIRIVTAARQALEGLGAMEVFAQKLRGGLPQERQETALLLSRMGEPAIELLLPLLSDPSPELRNSVVTSLGALAKTTSDARAVEGLVRALGDTSPYVQESAVLGLGSLGSPQTIDALVDLLRKGQLVPQVGAALESISRTSPEAAGNVVQRLQPLLEDPALELVERTVNVLRNLQVPEAMQALLAALQHASPRIRFAAVRSLVPYREDPGVQAAVEQVSTSDKDSLVRTTAKSFLSGELTIDQ